MEVPLCNIEIVQDGDLITAKVQSDLGTRTFTSYSLEGLLEQVFTDLQDEFEALI